MIDYLAADVIKDLQIADLTARAEQAEARLKEAVRDFYQYAQGGTEICAYCLHDNECEPGETMCGATFKAFRWRGMREGKDKNEKPSKCPRFFIDCGGQCDAPSCWNENKKDRTDYIIGVTCGGDKTKCCR